MNLIWLDTFIFQSLSWHISSWRISFLLFLCVLVIVSGWIILEGWVQYYARIITLHPTAEWLAQLVSHELLDMDWHFEDDIARNGKVLVLFLTKVSLGHEAADY